MKKLLLASVVAGLFTGSAFAADVSLYGVIDTGLTLSRTTYSDGYVSLDMPGLDKMDSATAFAMASGQHNGNRLGLKGSEDLGNDLTVSFKLENGFKGDTGALGKAGKLFDREARLTLTHTSGAEVSFGRMGTLSSNAGTYGNFWNYGDALGGGWGGTVGALNTAYAQVGSRFDNAIVIKTPTMAGLTGFAMYSLGNGTENAQSSQNDRYAALGAIYDNGPLGVALVAETYKPVNTPLPDSAGKPLEDTEPSNDAYNINLGASYDFDVVKVFAAYQYSRYALSTVSDTVWAPAFKFYDVAPDNFSLAGALRAMGGIQGHTMTLSASAPIAGGTLYTGYTLGLQKAEKVTKDLSDDRIKMTTHNLYVAYDYAISKRTTVYSGAAYTQYKAKNLFSSQWTAKVIEAQVGLVHKF